MSLNELSRKNMENSGAKGELNCGDPDQNPSEENLNCDLKISFVCSCFLSSVLV